MMVQSKIEKILLAAGLVAGLTAAIGFALLLFDVWDVAMAIVQFLVVIGAVCVIGFRILRFTNNTK